VSLIPGIKELLADKAYDTNEIRAFLKEHGIKAVISSKSNRKKKSAMTSKPTGTATSSNVASAGSRIGGASPRDTTSSLKISFLLAASSQPLPSGFELIKFGP
jgi:hypothetical protein